MKLKNSQDTSSDSAKYTEEDWNLEFTSALIAWRRWEHEKLF